MPRKKEKIIPREAFLWSKEKRGLRCKVCFRKCLIKRKGQVGYCRVRENNGKKIVAKNFGRILFADVKPVESLPLYHFLPGSKVLAVSSIGANLKGKIGFKDGYEEKLKDCSSYSPDDLVAKAEKQKVSSIAFLGNEESEPFLYPEFTFRTSRLALRSNIKPIYVTFGLGSEDVLKKLTKYMSAALVIFYAFGDEQFYKNFGDVKKVEEIFNTIIQLRKQRVHVEIASFVVPKVGDDLEKCSNLASWIVDKLGSEVPFHLLQFYSEEFPELPATPIEVLERCADEAKKTGLRYVYISNFPHPYNNTYCYNCLRTVIEREVGELKKIDLVDSRCPSCGFRINVIRE